MKTRRTFFVMIMALLVLSLMAGCALADDKLYTSEPFKIPADQVAQPEEVPEEPEAEPEGPAAGPESGEVIPEGTASAPEGTEPETPSEGTETLPEEGQLPEELPEGAEGAEGAEAPVEAKAELLPSEERRVYITSSRSDHVTEGEPIYLESHLEGFGDLEITYQWQVDRNDGAGWQNVGANRAYHVFVATAESVQYSWRLIVDTNE